jgi:hypothetical protein
MTDDGTSATPALNRFEERIHSKAATRPTRS